MIDVSGFGPANDPYLLNNLTNGGGGEDTLFDGRSFDLALRDHALFPGSSSPRPPLGFERLDLTGGVATSLCLNLDEVLSFTGDPYTLTNLCEAGDQVGFGLGWMRGADQAENSTIFAVYTQGVATIKVAQPVKIPTAPTVVDAKHPFTFLDAKGDKVTVKLTGKGSATLLLKNELQTGADLDLIRVAGPDAKSALSIAVTRAKVGGKWRSDAGRPDRSRQLGQLQCGHDSDVCP